MALVNDDLSIAGDEIINCILPDKALDHRDVEATVRPLRVAPSTVQGAAFDARGSECCKHGWRLYRFQGPSFRYPEAPRRHRCHVREVRGPPPSGWPSVRHQRSVPAAFPAVDDRQSSERCDAHRAADGLPACNPWAARYVASALPHN